MNNHRCAYYSAYSILLVEDDAAWADSMLTALEAEGFLVNAVYDGNTAIHAFADKPFDLAVLDVSLPGKNGFQLLRHVRETLKVSAPVIFVSDGGSLDDKRTGFMVGGDDYLTKPFVMEELLLRIKALLRRADSAAGFLTELSHGALRMSVRNRQVWVHGKEVRLPKKGLQILELLLTHPGRLITRESLERALWGRNTPDSDALRSQMHILRKILAGHGFVGIETVSGSGWRMGGH